MKNFQFEKDGKTFWYSRAVVCVTGLFLTDDYGHKWVLANKRGTATQNEQGKWNLPVGFLDFNETCRQCAAREIFEETGVKVPENILHLYNVNSNPDDGNQDIGMRYTGILNGTPKDYPVNLEHMEKNEATAAKWIPIEEVDSYEWAWNHRELIKLFLK